MNSHLNQLFLHLDDIVKISKSYLIKMILTYLKKKSSQYYKTHLVLRASLTRK